MSNKAKSGSKEKASHKSKAKAGGKGYSGRRRAQNIPKLVTWESNHRELGAGCVIETSANSSGEIIMNKSNVGKSGRGKSGRKNNNIKSGSGKEGAKAGTGKAGSKGGAGRADKGHRRIEIGLYACQKSGSWTCCKEYGDLGDDPVCCKGDYIGKSYPNTEKSKEDGSNSNDIAKNSERSVVYPKNSGANGRFYPASPKAEYNGADSTSNDQK